MKNTELHRILLQHVWTLLPDHGKGCHRRYEKDGKRYTAPYHKGKEINDMFAKKLLKELGIEL